MSAYEQYKAELAVLAALARANDFTDDGDKMFFDQYVTVKKAYYAACEEDESMFWSLKSFEDTRKEGQE
jgi:hypothetical protein